MELVESLKSRLIVLRDKTQHQQLQRGRCWLVSIYQPEALDLQHFFALSNVLILFIFSFLGKCKIPMEGRARWANMASTPGCFATSSCII